MYRHMNACPMKPNKFHLRTHPDYRKQEKFKGIRAFMFCYDGGSILQTRGGFFVEQNFPHLAKVKGNFVLDGELWQLGVEDEVIAGWANSKYLTADTSGVQFQCFDIVELRGTDLTSYSLERRDEYRSAAVLAAQHPDVLYVPYLDGDPDDHFAEIVARGGEGLMYKNMKSRYMQREGDNRPANHWYKEKGVVDFDVVVMGYNDAKPGKFEGLVGSVQYGMYFEGKLLYLGNCSGMTNWQREDITDHQTEYLNRVMEVRAAGQDLNSGALIEPRFIRWRDDKQPEQCWLVPEEEI